MHAHTHTHTHTHKVILLIKKNEILTCATSWIDPRRYNCKLNQSDTERQMPYNFTHMWNLRRKQSIKRDKPKNLRHLNR